MNEATLRRWANDQLSPSETRDVYRWMVRCTDPQLPVLLSGLMRERREREADQALVARGPGWRELVARWSQLLTDGVAAWAEPGAALQLASTDTQAAPLPDVRIEERSGGVVLVVDVDASTDTAVFITDDDGGAVRLAPSGGQRPQEWPLPQAGARPTVWVFLGDPLPVAAAGSTLDELMALTDAPDVRVVALRWTDDAT